ncbi:BspA family leucine-rich repeat surface protein [Ruminococcus sp.]|uniref:BspA family leucine-rich repeat surface protein n=1 Tax=Ruminococcus sp. TaxID=41978 RepID=UPI0025FB4966|nr:BspA family leucine-rich repeat surface protein [Ruminococcus sp.]
MENKWKKAAAFAMSLTLVAVNSAVSLSNSNTIVAKASEANSLASETEETASVNGATSEQGTDESFYDEETKTLHLKGYVRNGGDETGLVLPEGVDGRNVIHIVAEEGTVLPKDCRWLLLGLDYVETIDLKNADSSNVEDMSYMFADGDTYVPFYLDEESYLVPYSNITTIDLTGFDTSNVRDMSYMFAACTDLKTLDLSSFDTSNVRNMNSMFIFDISLESIDLSSFNTTGVSDMTEMFSTCYNLKDIDLSSFDTRSVFYMDGMFAGCSALSSLDLSNFNPRYVSNMSGMFVGCSGLKSLDISRFSTRTTEDMSHMFMDCRELESLDISNFDTRNVTNMEAMFFNCTSLETIIVDNSWSTKSVKEDSDMFLYCNNLKGSAGTSYDEAHTGTEYAHVDGGKENPGYFTLEDQNGDESYYDAETRTLHLKGNVRNENNRSGIIVPAGVDRNKIEHIIADEGTVLPVDCSFLFSNLPTQTIDLKNAYTSNVTDMSYMFYFQTSLRSVDFTNFDTSNVTNMECMFSWVNIDPFDLSNFDTSNVTNMSGMFSWGAHESLDLSNFNTSKVTNMSDMFGWNYNIKTIDISSFDTSNVTNMDSMFAACESLTTVYVGPDWTTENVVLTPWFPMFQDCCSLIGGEGTTISSDHDIDYAHADGGKENPGYFTLKEDNKDLSYFDEETKTLHLKGEVRGAGYFEGLVLPKGVDRLKVEHIIAEEGTVLPEDCSYFCMRMPNLKSVDLKNADSSNVTDMSYMFALWDDSPWELNSIDVSRFDTSKVTNMEGMFWLYYGTELDVSSFDTSNVTNMHLMFECCDQLNKLDLSNFNTSNVTNMSFMFWGCRALESLDLSSFDTANVTGMTGMFEECDSLETIIVGEDWSTKSVEESENMFTGSENLKGGAGTVYNENHTDAEYARIDGGKTAPGYFTSVNGPSEEDTTIVIVIPEEAMNAISYLYNNINNPTIKNIASTAMNFLGKYFSFKIV